MLARMPPRAAPELEIKFQLGADAMETMQAETSPPEGGPVAHLCAVYFDTLNAALRDAGFSLRIRRKNDEFVQTLKHRAAGNLFERDEWETPLPGPDIDLVALAHTPAAAVVGQSSLAPVFVVEVERRSRVRVQGEARIELSLDTGHVVAKDRREPIEELELELLDGPPQALFALARELQAKADLTPLFESKAGRGYRLIGHDGVAARLARSSGVGEATSNAAAFQLIARDALVQIAGNARLLQRAHNPDVLHRARIGIRRLRGAISAFKKMLDPEGLAAVRDEMRWLAGELAAARDLDVLLHRIQGHDDIEEDAARAAFLRALRIAQTEAYERALAAVRSARFRSLLLDVAEWIEIGGWRALEDDDARSMREAPAAALAAALLEKLDRRVKRRSRGFAKLDAAARHDLRKQVKKLRYATAAFGEAFPAHPKRRHRFLAALKALQDELGELNDITVARTVALGAVAGRSAEVAFAAGLEVGRLGREEAAALERAAAAVKAFRKARRYWSRPGPAGTPLTFPGHACGAPEGA
jgi:inorganic triphosphatase YgiF